MTGRGTEPFSGETLITAKGSREEALRAVTTVLRNIPDRAEQRAVLDALFAEAKRNPPRGLKGRPNRDPAMYQPCGTEARYQRHRRLGEPIDEACRKAASQSRMESQRRTRERRKAEAAAKEAA